jgi:hypothetical protein
VLLIAIICPALLVAQTTCVFVSNPTVATARIERVEPDTPRVGDIVNVSGTGNGTPPLQFAWDFGDGTQAAGKQAAHAYVAPGSYSVTLTVRDANGNAGRDSLQVTVSPRLLASGLSRIEISAAVARQPVLFAALQLREEPRALSHVWTFSDGQVAVGAQAAATFPAAGMYLASVAVTNDDGTITTAQIAFHVADTAH